MRIATFNIENFDDVPNAHPSLNTRIQIMRPQLERIRADILCLQEVNSQEQNGHRTLSALDALFAGTQYEAFQHRSTALTTGNTLYSEQNIVTVSRFPISATRIIRDDGMTRPSYRMATAEPPNPEARSINWERPILYSQITLPNGITMHVLNVHLKSKLPSFIPGGKINNFIWKSVSAWAEGSFISSMKRMAQAVQMRLTIDKIFDEHGEDALIAVCGDFNAKAEEVPVKTICGSVDETGNAAHAPRIMVPCERNIPESARYSLLHLGKGEMLDHVIVSRRLLGSFSHAEIHNEALPDESGAFRTDTQFPESDHAPVVAEFEDF